MKRRIKILLVLLWAYGLAWAVGQDSTAFGDERILSFDSHIVIHPEGDLVVTETLRVQAEGDRIRRGIYRDFPTRYKTRRGKAMSVGFEVMEVLRDQKPEAYRTENHGTGVRVYMGQKEVFLNPGVHTYTLTYRTDRQIGFFDAFDELYWNVTGNDWEFPIDKVHAQMVLPSGARVLKLSAYTGFSGDAGEDCQVWNDAGAVHFATTRPLAIREGLTIAVAWPKGYVAEPDLPTRMGYFWAENWGVLLASTGLLWLVAYYAIAWWRVGRDPERGTIIPRYAPPEGISPSAVRFVMEMGFDNKTLAVAVVNMAVKGYVTISEDKDGKFELHATGNTAAKLTPGEAKVAEALFPKGTGCVKLQNSSHRSVSAALKALRARLVSECEKVYFLRNTTSFLPGLGIFLLVLVGLVFSASEITGAVFIMIWLSMWSIGVYFLARQVVTAWRSRHVVGAMGITLFATPFWLGEIVGLGMLASLISLPGFLLFGGALIVNVVFYHLLKAPTLVGRRLMDEIEGLKLYMSVAEQDRLNFLHPPEQTPEHFENLLPYAMALDIENEWNERFADVLAKATVDPTSRGSNSMGWYHGRTPFSSLGAHIGGSFASAISSSSQAPGSSSGSGGGGSSGGGGGGGGGGGW